jgi:hypothetical protein
MDIYSRHLEATARWLLRSIVGSGGSAASFSPVRGWSRPYPETTGYIIPTLLDIQPRLRDLPCESAAHSLGEWLLSIQQPSGAWFGGLHPPGNGARLSVFNTAQILDGLVALHEHTKESRWLEAANRGARWLAESCKDDGTWGGGSYRPGFEPSYYTQVCWPMLRVWRHSQDPAVRAAAERVLRRVLARRKQNGVFEDWGFDAGAPAFTHTIAYTLRGFLESAFLLDDWSTYGEPTIEALERLVRLSERFSGRLPGAFDASWTSDSRYTCLTGNVQIALCLLVWEARNTDLRLVSAAAKLVDATCAAQSIRSSFAPIRGAVGGSAPLWGRYMFMRYPNWAAKYHCDALLALLRRVETEAR